MKLSQITNKKWNYTALAFAFPFVGMLFVMLISQYVPFGKYSMLYSDMYHQYFPFFKEFRRSLLSGDSLLYNWSVGLGMDYLGLYAYYLASPLNFLSVIVPEPWLLSYFSLLVPIKLGLASMFFALFLKNIFHKNDLSVSLFGSFYGLCAWALGYQWNIMWLDTFALLPLVVLGMVALLKENKFVLYTFTLFLSVFSNYYIGFFTCIFVFLLFFCYQICRWESLSKFCKDLCRIAFFSVLAIGMTAILELPAFAALQNTQSSVNKFPQGFQLNITDNDTWLGLLQAMAKVAGNTAGGIEPTFKEGLPNLYCGVFTTILSILYLFCPKIRLRDKICAVFLLLFFNVSFIIRQLDYIWHGFHFTNMIPYRFSFLYSFVVLYMAYSAWLRRNTFRFVSIIFAGVLSIGLLFFNEDLTDVVFWAYNGVFLLLYLSTLLYRILYRPVVEKVDGQLTQESKQAKIHHKRICRQILLGIMALELILNLVNFGIAFPGTYIANYPKGTSNTASIIRYMQELESDNLFYRVETTHTQTLNDGALNGYNGITTFTSSANVKVTEFMQTLGYGAKNTYNRYSFEESSPVANLFLGLKYMLERDGKVEDNSYFDDIGNYGDVHLLRNNAYLPLGFLAKSQLINVNFDIDQSRFEFQNKLMRIATGIEEDVWYILPGRSLTITGKGPSLSSKPGTGYCSYTAENNAEGIVTYSYTADRAGLLCANLELSKKNNFTMFLNGVELYSETYSLPQMLSVTNVTAGDIVEIQLKCKANESGTIKISTAILDETVFRKGHQALSASVLNLTHFSNTLIEGNITCGHEGVLYTSIPQNGNWYAEVDGNPAEIVTIGNVMVGLILPEGNHEIRFVYRNTAYSLGWKITLLCAVLFAVTYIVIYRPVIKRKKGMYER